jgi:hypothetical protein
VPRKHTGLRLKVKVYKTVLLFHHAPNHLSPRRLGDLGLLIVAPCMVGTMHGASWYYFQLHHTFLSNARSAGELERVDSMAPREV